MAKQIDSEELVLWIEKCKQGVYESLVFAEGLENPEVLAQITNRIMGEQCAYDHIIAHIRNLQGSDAE